MDIERFAAESLSETTGLKVVLEVPADKPEEFVSVELTGSPSKRFLEEPTLAVQSWAKTRRRAAEIAKAVERAIWFMASFDEVVSVNSTSTYRWPDPESRHQRYQTVANLTIHTD